MNTLDGNLILEKNKLAGEAPWLILLDVEISTGVYIYLVRNTEDITFNSINYQAFPVEIDERQQVSKGEIPTLTIRVSNINRLVQTYLEDYDGLVGNDITLRIVSRYNNTGDWTEAISFTYEVLSTVADAMYVTFTLGAPNPLNRRFPLYKYIPNHCNWEFESDECNYTFNPVGTWTAEKQYWAGDLVYPNTVGYTNYTFRCIQSEKSGIEEPTWSTVTEATIVENNSFVRWVECTLTTWTASRRYYTGSLVHPTTSNGHNYRALNEGVSDGTEPTWPTRLGAVVVDNNITWTVNDCKRSLKNCRDLNNSDNFGGHPGLSRKGMKVVE